MRIFVSNLTSSFSRALLQVFAPRATSEEKEEAEEAVEIVGTVATKSQLQQAHYYLKQNGLQSDRVVLSCDVPALTEAVLASDVIFYDLQYQNQPKDVLQILRILEQEQVDNEDKEDEETTSKQRKLIAISTVMTWARNKIDLSTHPEGFDENEYKQRKPSRKFAEYKAAEIQVISANKEGLLSTCVIASGLVYGGKDNSFQYLFKEAWRLASPNLPIPCIPGKSDGENLLPMISVYDLATFAAKLAIVPKFPKSYMIAVDSSKTNLRQVSHAISLGMGTGSVRQFTAEEAQLALLEEPSISTLQVNLFFKRDPEILEVLSNIDSLGNWKHEEGLLCHINTFIDDYKSCMNLFSPRLFLTGPPLTRKSEFAQVLAKYYYLPVITPWSVTCEIKDRIATNIDPTEDSEKSLRVALENVDWNESSRNQVLDNELVEKLITWKLSSQECCNHGYVLDGYPINSKQATRLFQLNKPPISENEEKGETEDQEDQDENNEEGEEPINQAEILLKKCIQNHRNNLRLKSYIPNRIISFDASDDFLKEKVLELSEDEAVKSCNTEELFTQRLALFRKENENENLISFYEKSLDIDILEINIESECDKGNLVESMKRYIEKDHGKPFNFHPTKEELQQAKKEEEIRRTGEASLELIQQQEILEKELAEKEENDLKEKTRLEQIAKEEKVLLETRSMPLRNYLMENVIPTLTEGMLEVVKVQPDDPIDYLADFLFRKGEHL